MHQVNRSKWSCDSVVTHLFPKYFELGIMVCHFLPRKYCRSVVLTLSLLMTMLVSLGNWSRTYTTFFLFDSGHNCATLHYGHAGAPNDKLICDGDMWWVAFDLNTKHQSMTLYSTTLVSLWLQHRLSWPQVLPYEYLKCVKMVCHAPVMYM